MSTSFTSARYTVSENPESIATADFNGDGNLDLATTTQTANGVGVAILLGDGTGKFVAAKNSSVRQGANLTAGSLAVGDFNRDNRPDLVIASYSNNPTATPSMISLLLGDGAGEFAAPSNYSSAGSFSDIAIPGDFNLDGNLDVLSSSVLLGDGTGQLKPGAAVSVIDYDTVSLSGNPSIAIGDVNNDGKLDVLEFYVTFRLWFTNGFISIFPGDGAGGFTDQQLGQDANSYFGAIATADVNHDGNLDVITTGGETAKLNQQTNSVIGDVLLGNGRGQFHKSKAFATTGNSIAFADFNGDGKLDLVANAANGRTSITLGDGTGRFGKPTLLYQAKTGSSGVNPIAIGDFNHDGKPDLATADGAANTISVLLNSTSRTDPIVLSKFAERKLVNVSSESQQGLNTDLAKGILRLGALRKNIKGYTDVIGTARNDVIKGNNQDNRLDGSEGDDRLIGGNGNDTLTGDAGNDILTGGNGKDRFVFKSNIPDTDSSSSFERATLQKTIGVDKITDFTPGIDKIVLDRNLFTSQTSRLSNSRVDYGFVDTVQQVKRSKALIVYMKNTGQIYYNANRTEAGFGDGGLFAEVTKNLALNPNDFVLV
jgi:Ca2+-binding RTX toxin-like protein